MKTLALDTIPLTAAETLVHERAMTHTQNYKKSESDVLVSIEEIDRLRLFEKFRCRSARSYCCKFMNIDENMASVFITVARKGRAIPELIAAVRSGALEITKAKTICPVLTSENQADWIGKARVTSKWQLEREVADLNPDKPTRPLIKHVGPNRNLIRVEVTDETLSLLREVIDIESRPKSESATIDQAMNAAFKVHLRHKDPVRKADRALKRRASRPVNEQEPLHASEDDKPPIENIHIVNARDRGRCRALVDGEICGCTRWTHIHHIIARADGGNHDPENLITLCSQHHAQVHSEDLRL